MHTIFFHITIFEPLQNSMKKNYTHVVDPEVSLSKISTIYKSHIITILHNEMLALTTSLFKNNFKASEVCFNYIHTAKESRKQLLATTDTLRDKKKLHYLKT